MSWEVEFYVNTETRYFEEMLERFRLQRFPRYVDVGNNRGISIIGAPTFKGQNSGRRVHAIEASLTKIDPERPDFEHHEVPTPIIIVMITEVAPARIKVLFRFHHDAVADDVRALLVEITENWPETSEKIRSVFNLEDGRIEETKWLDDEVKSTSSVPNKGTIRKIIELVEIREEAIRSNKLIPMWTVACNLVGIDPKTVIKYAGDLRANWDKYDFYYDKENFRQEF